MNIFGLVGERASSQSVQEIKRYISREESDFIALARIVMIIALVFHHVFTLPGSDFYPRHGIDPSTAHIADYLNSIVHWTAMAAVPCLSVISGYLFFRRQRVNYFELLHRRITTVVLPSIAWTSFWFFFAFLTHVWGENNGHFEWVDYDFDTIGPGLYLDGALGISRLPYAYQFWFVHDLVLTFALCPVIGWLTARAPWVLLMGLGLIWIFHVDIYPFFSPNVLLFFSVGAVAATTRFDFDWALRVLRPFRWVIGLSFVALLLGRMFQDSHRVLASYRYLCLLRGTGLLTFILLMSSLTLRDNLVLRVLRYLSPFSFFIFAFHFPTLGFIKDVIFKIPGFDSEIGMLVFFLVLPVSCVAISMVAALSLRWLSPSLFAFVNGGRADEGKQ
ncbi:acyltransferase family protein [Microbulbifer hainanensis]|uniref:acyltransferase family protein n=1 Tax=Microbulbifer hainanensis TaxID=2735675 RepID=UPI001866C224|nr:acyltransferase family protein [Microbulbifer hainanensis]